MTVHSVTTYSGSSRRRLHTLTPDGNSSARDYCIENRQPEDIVPFKFRDFRPISRQSRCDLERVSVPFLQANDIDTASRNVLMLVSSAFIVSLFYNLKTLLWSEERNKFMVSTVSVMLEMGISTSDAYLSWLRA